MGPPARPSCSCSSRRGIYRYSGMVIYVPERRKEESPYAWSGMSSCLWPERGSAVLGWVLEEAKYSSLGPLERCRIQVSFRNCAALQPQGDMHF